MKPLRALGIIVFVIAVIFTSSCVESEPVHNDSSILEDREPYEETVIGTGNAVFSTDLERRELWERTEIEEEDIIFSVETAEDETGKAVFFNSIGDFILSFNRIYGQVYDGSEELPPLSKWTCLPNLSPCFSYDSVYYCYPSEEETQLLPTVSVYKSEESGGIYELKLTFDDHAYREELYELFEKRCFCALKTFLPAQSNADICSLYDTLYDQTNENDWGDYFIYGEGKHPALNKMYQYDSVGLYGYYGAGTVNICIVPLTEGSVSQLTRDGVKIVG